MSAELILVVDDNESNVKLVRFLLKKRGYDVCVATNAPEALAVLERCLPQLILMDLQLPGMDGLQLTRKIKADPRTRSIPVIAVTAYAMKGDEEKARRAGCDGYITKPIDTHALPTKVAEYLSRSGKEI